MKVLLHYPVACVFLAGWFASDLLTPLIRWLAMRIGIADIPGGHKMHRAPTPTLGGIAVFLAFVISIVASLEMSPPIEALTLGSALIVLTGVCDDVRGVGAPLKFVVIMAATAILVEGGAVVHLSIPVPLVMLATFLWAGFVTSAFNGVDNTDGAAPGLCAIAGISVFTIAWSSYQHNLAIVAAALVGCSLGFLRYNFPPASIFLGDSGSFFLGFSLAAMLLIGRWGSPLKDILIPIMILAVPLFDFMLILVFRGIDGHYKKWLDPLKMCAYDHTAHRLRQAGFTVRETIMMLYLAALLCGGLALWMFRLPDADAVAVFLSTVAGASVCAAMLRRLEMKGRATVPHTYVEFLPVRDALHASAAESIGLSAER